MTAFYRFARRLLRFGLRAYFREIRVHGREHFAPGGCRVVVANHHNSMIDPFLLIAASDRQIAFIAKAPLFRVPILGWFLRLLLCVPAYRSQDPGYAKERNDQLYDAAAKLLAGGTALAMFPEGRSHTEPQLGELKHGASKIAIEAELRQGGVGLQLVGIHFERTRGFRGRVLVQFGPPLMVDAYRDRYAQDPRAATAALTEEVQAGLRGMILTAESHETLQLADLVGRMGVLEAEGDSRLQEIFDRKKRLLDLYSTLKKDHPRETRELEEDLRQYRETLADLGVRDEHIAQDFRPGRILGYTILNLLLLALGLPFVAVGLACNFPPYLLSWVISRFGSRSQDVQATLGFMSALLFIPIYWTGLAYAGWRVAGLPGLAVAALAAPLSGYLTLRSLDRWHRFLRATWGLLTALTLRAARRRLKATRARVLDRVRRLTELRTEAER